MDLGDGLANFGGSLARGFAMYQERKERKKEQAKLDKRLFDSYVTQGEALGHDPNRLKTMSLGEVQGLVDGEKLKRTIAQQEQEGQVRAAQLRKYLLENEEMEGRAAALPAMMNDFNAMRSGQPTLAQMQQYFDSTTAEMPNKPAGAGAMSDLQAFIQAASMHPGAVDQKDLARVLMETAGDGGPFQPSGGVQEIAMPGGETIAVPYARTSKNQIQLMPEFSKGNNKYDKPLKQGLSEVVKLRVGVMKSELDAINRGLATNAMLTSEDKKEMRARQKELKGELNKFFEAEEGKESKGKESAPESAADPKVQALIDQANEAIRNGADREKVLARLKEMGIEVTAAGKK